MASAVRVWGPTNEAFVAYERRFPTGDDIPHELYLKGYECNANGGPMCGSGNMPVTFAEQLVGNALYHDQFLNPSAALTRVGSGARQLSTVRRRRIVDGCDGDTTAYRDEGTGDPEAQLVDLEESEWFSDTETETNRTVETDLLFDGECTDRGVSYTRYDPSVDRPRAVWRWDDDPLDATDKKQEVRHGVRGSGGRWTKTVLSNEDPNAPGTFYDQDHPALDIDAGQSLVVHRSVQGTDNKVLMRFLSDPADPRLTLTSDGDYPNLDVSSTGWYHAVWHDHAPGSIIWHGECDALQDCK